MRSFLSLMLIFTLVTLSCNDNEVKPDLVTGFWIVQTLEPSGGQVIDYEGVEIGIVFTNESMYILSMDINQCSGNYSITKDFGISFDTSGFCTQSCCDSNESDIFGRIVLSATGFSLDEDQLTISGPDGEVELQRMN